MISLKTQALSETNESLSPLLPKELIESIPENIALSAVNSWKAVLNQFRIILMPFIYVNALSFWLELFPNPELSDGFTDLLNLVNHTALSIFPSTISNFDLFSSA